MNSFEQLVSDYARLARGGEISARSPISNCPKSEISPNAPNVLLFSPHPDDEVITGALPLRLLRDAKWNVVNVAVTLGSKPERRSERLEELKRCCECIGFGLLQLGSGGLDRVNINTRKQDTSLWAQHVTAIAGVLSEHRPRAIFLPHRDDWNATHIGTHLLVSDALKTLPPEFGCFVVETEFWQAMDSPNLMVEVGTPELADLVAALACHVGEVKRNPYHRSLPAWMIDNVRRGAELVSGQGAAAPDFPFAILYRLRKWSGGKLKTCYRGGKILGLADDPVQLFRERKKSSI
jgi:LmbE family N-acetylglucosaminyl deacetylase